MKKQLLRKLTCCVCAAAMLLGSAALPGAGSETYGAVKVPKDAANHWAKSFIVTAIEKGVISGYDDGISQT